MAKVIELQSVQHIFEVDSCAGCGEVIQDEYTEIGLPSGNGKEVKHIALCDRCDGLASNTGAY